MINAIVAVSENNVIGRNGDMPWHLRDDLKSFKSKTSGHPVIMGSSTFRSIGRPLPNRSNIVLSRDPYLQLAGATVVHDATDGLACAAKAEGSDEVFVIGGGAIYQLYWSKLERIYCSKVHAEIKDGDTFFPEINPSEWKLISEQEVEKSEHNNYAFTFQEWLRK